MAVLDHWRLACVKSTSLTKNNQNSAHLVIRNYFLVEFPKNFYILKYKTHIVTKLCRDKHTIMKYILSKLKQ